MARKPQPGGDQGTWGQILNDYLAVSHNDDGSLKDGTVHASTLDASAPNDGQVLSYNNGLTWATVTASGTVQDATASAKGLVQLAGDLAGTAAAPTVPGLANKADASALTSHTSNTANPHAVTKAQVGLGSVDNTSDINKPISSATQTALDGKASVGHTHTTGQISGLATVASTGAYADLTGRPTVPAQFNPIAGTNVTLTGTYPNVTISATPGAGVTDLTATAGTNTVTVVSSTGDDAVLPAATTSSAGVLTSTDKTKLDGIQAGAQANTVTSVASKTGAVTLVKGDVGLGNVDNTSDANKPISSATQTALNAKLGTDWNIRPVIYATGISTWPAGRPVPAGYSGPVTWDSLAYPGHPDPTTMQAGDDWLRRLS